MIRATRRGVAFMAVAAAAVVIVMADVAPVAAQASVIAITGVTVVDVVNGRNQADQTVVVRGTTIASVTPGGAAPAGARVVDGRGRFLMPGLWDMHAHTEMSEIMTIGTPASLVSADRMAYVTKANLAFWAANQQGATPAAVRSLGDGAMMGAQVARDMARAGVGLLAGCDSMIAGFCVHDELAQMNAGGMTPLAALQTATVNPARYLGLERETGRVASVRADLVLLDGDPLTDIANVGHIRAVIVAGRWLDRKALDGLLDDARAAAR